VVTFGSGTNPQERLYSLPLGCPANFDWMKTGSEITSELPVVRELSVQNCLLTFFRASQIRGSHAPGDLIQIH
jgi:hypothetical protein